MHKITLAVSLFIVVLSPLSAFAWVDLGAYYYTPGPNSQAYYQPLYAYSSYGPARLSASGPDYNGAPKTLMPGLPSSYGYQQPYNYSYQQPYQYGYQQSYSNYGYQQYSYYPQQYNYQPYSYYQGQQYYQPNYYGSYGYAPYGQGVNMYGQNVPYSYGYPTGETVPLIGGQLCDFPDYNGRALCGSNPNQYVYDSWTGSWY